MLIYVKAQDDELYPDQSFSLWLMPSVWIFKLYFIGFNMMKLFSSLIVKIKMNDLDEDQTDVLMLMKACKLGLLHKEVTWTLPRICFNIGDRHPPKETKSADDGFEFNWPEV